MPEVSKTKLRLPKVCDPPGPNNPAQQKVWIVSCLIIYTLQISSKFLLHIPLTQIMKEFRLLKLIKSFKSPDLRRDRPIGSIARSVLPRF